KEHANASFGKSCSENQAVREFMKASEILMQRNAADLGKIRELFQKYSCKSPEEVNSKLTASAQNKSDEEKANDLPACTEKPLLPKNPLHSPQLSDFGLSQYAFSRPWSAVKTQHTRNVYQQKSKNETPLKMQTPRTLPRTPKCKLKMDGFEFATPKLEHFGISEHTMCMNEDYTTSLIHKTAQTIQKENTQYTCDLLLSLTMGSALGMCCLQQTLHCQFKGFRSFRNVNKKQLVKHSVKCLIVGALCSIFHKLHLTNSLVVLFQSSLEKVSPDFQFSAADWMASPMVVVFCTPDVKVSSKTSSAVLPRSPETKELPLPSHAATPQCPDFQTIWLKREAKVVNSNYIHFHTLCPKQFFNSSFGGNTESVTKSDARDKQYKDSIPFAVSPDAYLKHLGDPSPPTIKHYDQLLNTPPPPEITRIPDDVLQILSKYNHKAGSSNAKEMEIKAGNTTRCESGSTDYCNKENRYDYILQLWL
ncbi:SKA3 protein, partial [Mionectes macconnelli]|nr:SKA3 protein [Mionectes macconnelli]